MRYIKVQDTVINFDQVTAFYVKGSELIVEFHSRVTVLVYSSSDRATHAFKQILMKLNELRGFYAGEVE